MKKINALIPARSGSKGIPNKNIYKIHGHPLIAYSIVAAINCDLIDRVMVSTNCGKIANIAKEYGAEIPFIRPNEFADDMSTDFDVINHFFKNVNVNEILYLRPTSPLRDPKEISKIISFYFKNGINCSGIRSMQKNTQPPYKLFHIDKNGYGKGFFDQFNGIKDYTNLPRQTFPQSYMPNGYADICKKQTLEKYGTAFGTKIIPQITDSITDIDTISELKFLDFQLSTEGHIILDLLNGK